MNWIMLEIKGKRKKDFKWAMLVFFEVNKKITEYNVHLGKDTANLKNYNCSSE